jgi:hypothetical protein
MAGEQKLTRFLIALAHSPELMDQFNGSDEERRALLAKWGVENEPALARTATLADVQAAVEAENKGADVAWWIRFAQVDPETWIVEGAEETGGDTTGGDPTAS